MKKLVVSLILSVSALFAQQNLYKGDVNAKEAYKMQQNGTLIVDIRTQEEFDISRPKGAKHVPFYTTFKPLTLNENFVNDIKEALGNDTSKEVILICRSGSRTKVAANMLAKEGFTNVYHVTRGFGLDWSRVDLPIEK